jgi:hypothetical protein
MTGDSNIDRPNGSDPALPSAWRITFEYDASGVRVVALQRVAMIAPPDDSDLVERGEAGYWVELRNADLETIYCQVLGTPLQQEYEVFSPDPSVGIQRVEAEEPAGIFQAVVPDLEDAHEIVLRGRPSPHEIATRASKQLVKARLRERPYPEGWAEA